MNQYRLTWTRDDDCSPGLHRNTYTPDDIRPSLVQADSYTYIYNEGRFERLVFYREGLEYMVLAWAPVVLENLSLRSENESITVPE